MNVSVLAWVEDIMQNDRTLIYTFDAAFQLYWTEILSYPAHPFGDWTCCTCIINHARLVQMNYSCDWKGEHRVHDMVNVFLVYKLRFLVRNVQTIYLVLTCFTG
ncbi:hypothetical protein CDAR_462911 [Caerostris darwini]|uniref:Uncharacterized protein n=1 Tax=Caerostris darwini TaxID=1538125 RepID=A0AAV4QBN0_9ARAC|nr:hypothetical protein CDAR_462911 [Caerostris darwini]